MEFMKFKWTHRERVASAIVGSVSTVLLVATVFTFNTPFMRSIFFNLGVSLNGFALALVPKILLKKIPLKTLKSQRPGFFKGSLFLHITGDACFLIAGWFWFLETF
jgi:hypothetical protein